MIKKFLKHLLVAVIFFVFTNSCTKEVDFNQAKDLVLEPIVASDLIFFKAPAIKFNVNGVELSTVRDSVIIDLFNRDFVVENLVKAEFVFETKNSINRAFNVQVDFLDSFDALRHSFSISTLASPTNNDITVMHTEVFENASLDDLKSSNKVVLTVQALSSGALLNDNTQGRIQLKSKGIFYLKIEVSE
ncbi:hypothetical protein L3X37_14490 [Sabulilitoribacter arenilitoris]|uniref:Late embryogenesis abundant protein LEA-2 subgroup domain-containing protein n=1 Tax=Wocania arenilitoris TaxID=2044858 RepID=A0AAE3ESJ2_9FLAO|nr:hypothetical protein [Wocania arenilitoris]MCF7569554.1 hypothetical protein [Wocania arenilitoris]